MISVRKILFVANVVLVCVLVVLNVYRKYNISLLVDPRITTFSSRFKFMFITFSPVVSGSTTIVDIKDYEYGADIFFEIVDPPELQYTYRIRPAKTFGTPFVITVIYLFFL